MIIAGTGHRPKFCPCGYKDDHPWLLDIKEKIRLEIQPASKIITGMAIGMDTWLAQVALEEGKDVIAYVPFPGQGEAWPKKSKDEYNRILSLCAEVKIICPSYTPDAFFIRDEAMVNDCDLLLALWSGIESGGTYHTVQYALSKNVSVKNIWPIEGQND